MPWRFTLAPQPSPQLPQGQPVGVGGAVGQVAVGLPEIDDVTLADLIQPGQAFTGGDPLDYGDGAAKLLPAVGLGPVAPGGAPGQPR